MSKKSRKKAKKVVYLQAQVFPKFTPTWCGFPLNLQNYNRLWRWDTLEDVNL